MQSWIHKTVVLLSLLFIGYASAENYHNNDITPCPKTYLDEGEVHVVDSELWINLDGEIVCPGVIYVDEGGSYFEEVRTNKWWCWNCWWLNKEEAHQCSICYKPRPRKDDPDS